MSAMRQCRLLLPFFACLVLLACGRNGAGPGSWVGDYRVALQLPGGELPFGLELREQEGQLLASIVNGVVFPVDGGLSL